MSKTPINSLSNTGCDSDDVLLGIHPQSNSGMLLHVFEPQLKGVGGRIRGPFRILHSGNGKYSSGIRSVIDRNSFFGSASEFVQLVAQQNGCGDCTHILNANALWKLDAGLIIEHILNGATAAMSDDKVRRCKSCGQIYHDVSLNFCLQDGTPLYDESAEIETVILGHRMPKSPSRRNVKEVGIEYIRAAVAKHPSLGIKIHPGSNHRITKRGHTGSVWIIPRHGGVSITANGQASQRLYREMERLLGKHHREDAKGYRYYQANDPREVEQIIGTWAAI